MRTIKFNILAILLLAFILNCGAKPKTRVFYEIDPSTPSPQTLGGVSIDVEYVGKEDIQKYNGDFKFVLSEQTKGLVFLGVAGQAETVYPFKGIVGFHAKITNNTDHILRMRDARIVFEFEGNPYTALQREELASIMAKKDGSPTLESAFYTDPQTKLRFKLINDLSSEILPGYSSSGYIAFGISPESAVVGTLTFFDITTKVDSAGNPVEKTKFQFKIARKIIEI